MPESFIEQSFIPCQDKPEGTAAPQATPDECYDGPVLTLSHERVVDSAGVPGRHVQLHRQQHVHGVR